MNLKEAFRYQNKLSALTDEAQGILENENNVTLVTNTLLRHKVNPDATDETTVNIPDTVYYEQITDVVRFLVYLLGEKKKLAGAIRLAKSSLDIDLDSEVGLNVSRQALARVFKKLSDLRPSEKTIINGGTGYKFNVDGAQVSYRCDVKRVTQINYDRSVVRECLAKLNKESDGVSAALDLCLVNSSVDYEPPFDVNSSFADAFEQFVGTAGK
ncbi:MAG: hypothetical protein IKY07_06085 [Clostridia bacterium]|nr:hypothetical protein [Clostridia bacterium]MBR5006641.1 hypothetical protein [Clostridia bacterium]